MVVHHSLWFGVAQLQLLVFDSLLSRALLSLQGNVDPQSANVFTDIISGGLRSLSPVENASGSLAGHAGKIMALSVYDAAGLRVLPVAYSACCASHFSR